jgi:hypothetical protein
VTAAPKTNRLYRLLLAIGLFIGLLGDSAIYPLWSHYVPHALMPRAFHLYDALAWGGEVTIWLGCALYSQTLPGLHDASPAA